MACIRFTGCGSEKGKFSFLLPHGNFELQVYSEGPEAKIAESATPNGPKLMAGDIRLEVKGTEREINLGTIELVPNKDTASVKVAN